MSSLSRRGLIIAAGSAALLSLTATEQAAAGGLGAAATRNRNRKPAMVTIPVGGAPRAVVLTPDHRYAYVPCVLENAVDIIDLRTDKLTAQVPVGSAPTDIAFNHSGSLAYVTNTGSGTVSVLDTATRRVTHTITAGQAPISITVKATHAGDNLYVADNVGNAVLLLDARTGRIRHQWRVDEPAAAVSTSNGYVVAPSVADGDVLVINTRTLTSDHLRRPDGFGTNPGQITPAGTVVPLPGEVATTWLNTATMTFNGNVAPIAPGITSSAALTRDGHYTVLTTRDFTDSDPRTPGNLSVICNRDHRALSTYALGVGPDAVAIGPTAVLVAQGPADNGTFSVVSIPSAPCCRITASDEQALTARLGIHRETLLPPPGASTLSGGGVGLESPLENR